MLRFVRVLVTVAALAAATQGAPAQTAPPPALPPARQTAVFGTLHVARYGIADGATPVVLIPDLACGPWEYAALIAHLATSRAVYAVTLPGMDGTPAAPPPLIPRFEQDLAEMFARLDVEHPVVIGSGLGGVLAIDVATRRPDAVSGTVVIDTTPVFPGTENLSYAERRAAATAAAAAVPRDPSLFLQMLKRDDRATGVLDARLVDRIATFQSRSDSRAVAQWLTEEIESDLRPVLPRIAAPFLAIVSASANDESERKAYAAAFFTSVPSVTVVTIAPARRFITFDAPDALRTMIDSYLSAQP